MGPRRRFAGGAVAVLAIWSAAGVLFAAEADPSEKSCLACHDASRLASLKLHGLRGPEIIPEDPAERGAIAALMSEPDTPRRRQKAEAFLQTYPASWMLEPVYEVASKASMAMGDLPAAVAYGRSPIAIEAL